MTNEELSQRISDGQLANGYFYARLDLAKLLLGLSQEGGFDKRTIDEISDRAEHIYEMRKVTNFSLPEEILKP